MLSNFPSLLADHLWQSTMFAIGAALVTLALRKNHARTRFWIWWIASLKFLVPFSLLVSLGANISWTRVEPSLEEPASSLIVIEQFARPFTADAPHTVVEASAPPASAPFEWTSLAVVFLAIWV